MTHVLKFGAHLLFRVAVRCFFFVFVGQFCFLCAFALRHCRIARFLFQRKIQEPAKLRRHKTQQKKRGGNKSAVLDAWYAMRCDICGCDAMRCDGWNASQLPCATRFYIRASILAIAFICWEKWRLGWMKGLPVCLPACRVGWSILYSHTLHSSMQR